MNETIKHLLLKENLTKPVISHSCIYPTRKNITTTSPKGLGHTYTADLSQLAVTSRNTVCLGRQGTSKRIFKPS